MPRKDSGEIYCYKYRYNCAIHLTLQCFLLSDLNTGLPLQNKYNTGQFLLPCCAESCHVWGLLQTWELEIPRKSRWHSPVPIPKYQHLSKMWQVSPDASSWSFGATVGLSPGSEAEFRADLITVNRSGGGGCSDAGMINAQLSLHFLNIIIVAVQQSLVKIGTLKAGHGAWYKAIFCHYLARYQCFFLWSH